MHKLALIPLVTLLACGNTGNARPIAVATPAAGSTQTRDEMLPARTLRCTLGHALNIDVSKFQTTQEIKYEGAHSFALFLPAVPKLAVAPDPTDAAEPVNPATRIIDDPDGLAHDMVPSFTRVVDLWPQRVEMIGAIAGEPSVRLIIISEIDLAKGTANLFTSPARDAASLDLKKIYQGSCKVEVGPELS